jgi:hypothetical protein
MLACQTWENLQENESIDCECASHATIFHKRRSKMDILRGGCVSIVDYLDLFWTLEERVKTETRSL